MHSNLLNSRLMGKIKLREIDSRATKGWDKQETRNKLVDVLAELDELQNLLYAESKHALLVIIQGMDASGKDGAIRNVFGKLNPQGVLVKSFKTPTAEELAHDFLWRIHAHAPAKGLIHLFNRSNGKGHAERPEDAISRTEEEMRGRHDYF